MDSKAAISSNWEMAAMASCRRQRKGNPCQEGNSAEAMIFYQSHNTPR